MGTISSAADDAYDEFNTSGLPSTGRKKPSKAQIRALWGLVQSQFDTLVEGQILGGAVVYTTRAQLYDHLGFTAGKLGVVSADPNAAYNGVYLKDGAVNAGAWSPFYVGLRTATRAETKAGASTTTGVSPDGLNYARGFLPAYQLVEGDGAGAYGDRFVIGWVSPPRNYRGVTVRDSPLYLRDDGRVAIRIHAQSFLDAEASTFIPDSTAIALGARGQVFGARKIGATLYSYSSTQDGHFTLPYRAWQDAPLSNTGFRAQLLATNGYLDIHAGDGQSWRSDPLNTAIAPFSTDGEPYAAWTFQNVFGNPLQMVGVESQLSLIVGLVGIGPTVGQAIDTVAAESLARLQRDEGYQMTPMLAWSSAYPGYRWDQLGPGTEPWRTKIGYIEASRTFAAKYGLKPRFRSFSITESCAESRIDTVDAGVALATWIGNHVALDLNSGGDPLHFFIDVTPAVAGDTTPYDQSWQQIAFALANANGRTWMVGPRYQFGFVDDIHHGPYGKAKIGEQEAWAKHVVFNRKLPWTPLSVTRTGANPNVTVSGNTVTIQVNSPVGAVGPIVRDTTLIGAAANDGLVVKVGGVVRAISAIVLNANSIVITLGGAAVGAGVACEVSYAAYGAGAASGTHSGVWGNLKKAGPASRFYPGEKIDFWLMPMKVTVNAL